MEVLKNLIVAVIIIAVVIQLRLSSLNLHPIANSFPPLPKFPSSDKEFLFTGNVEVIGEYDLIGPEAMVIHQQKYMFVSLMDGRIVRIEEEDGDGQKLKWTPLVRTGSIPLSDTTTPCGKGWYADTTNTEAICGRPLGIRLVKRSTVDPNYDDSDDDDEDVLLVADPYIGLM